MRREVSLVIASALAISLGITGGALGQEEPTQTTDAIEGVLSVTPVLERSYMAVQIEVPAGQSLASLRWFNNDGGTRFPRVAVTGGTTEEGPNLDQVLFEVSDVGGAGSAWNTVEMPSATLLAEGPLFVVFQLPAFDEHTGTGVGGGAGIGYRRSAEAHRGWISRDGVEWLGLARGLDLAIEPVLTAVPGGMGLTSARPKVGSSLEATPTPSYLTDLAAAVLDPASGKAIVRFSLGRPGRAVIDVFNSRGQRVATAADAELSAGPHVVEWLGTDDAGSQVASGTYFVRLEADGQRFSQKLLWVR